MGRLAVRRRLLGTPRAQYLAFALALSGGALAGNAGPARRAAPAPRPRTLYLEYRESWAAEIVRVADPNVARIRRTGRVWMSVAGAYRESLERPLLLRWYLGDERWEWLPNHQVAAHWQSAAWPQRGWWLFGPDALRAPLKPQGKPAGAATLLGRACTIYEELFTDSYQRREVQVAVRVWWDDALRLPLRRAIALDNWETVVIEATRLYLDWPIADSFFTDRRLPAGTRIFEGALDLESVDVRLRRPKDLSVVFFDLRFWAVRGLSDMALPVPYNLPKDYDYEGMLPERILLARRGEEPPVPRPLRIAFLNLDTQDILWWSLEPARGPLPGLGELRQLEWCQARITRMPDGATRVVCDLAGTRLTAEAHGLSADDLADLVNKAGAWWTREISVSFVGWGRQWRWLPDDVARQASAGRPGFSSTPVGTDEVVLGVQRDGPAERAGLRPWDRVIAIDGVFLSAFGREQRRDIRHDAITALITGPVGSTVALRVVRSGRSQPLDLKVARSVEPVERY